MIKHAIMNTDINIQEETLINYVPKSELESIYSDVCLDLFLIGSEDTFHTIMSTDSIKNKLNEKIKIIN